MKSKIDTINIVVVAGIRAHFMKTASFQRTLKRFNATSTVKILPFYINTGQHYDDVLAGVFIKELDIHFDITYSYEIKKPINIFSDMLLKLDSTFEDIEKNSKIDWIIVFGDANSTMAGAIVAAKRKLPLIHIEAGLRSGNIKSPEEINRVVTDHLSTVHFVSSKKDIANLKSEGLIKNVIWTGDIIYDLVKSYSDQLPSGCEYFSDNVYILATIHREENLQCDNVLINLLNILCNYFRPVLFITHPRTLDRIKKLRLLNIKNIKFISNLNYGQMLSAIKGCSFIITDSGALQRESYYLKKRCLIRQEVPFWPTLVEANVHRLIGSDQHSIITGLTWIENAIKLEKYPQLDDLGKGNSVELILKNIVKFTKSESLI